MAFITVNRSNLYKSVAFVSALAAFLFLTNILRLNPHIDSQAPPPISEPTFQVKIRSGFVVLQNYIKAEKWYYGNESITYTSHSDATFLHNLIPMLKRWRGPLSIAIYAPGSDYDKVLRAIAYFRECPEGAHLVRKFTTFHIFYETRYAPSRIVDFGSEIVANCSEIPGDEGSDTFKKANNLLYPINVGRNVAREMATTHFVLPSDIELYPNPGMIQGFLHMMAHPEPMIRSSPRPKVYVVSIFEIEKDHEQPTTKADLLAAMKSGIVIPFHKRYCPLCHEIPGAEKWVRDDGTEGKTHVIEVGKRVGKHQSWEPIYIGTHSDPLYDERLSWDGRSDKMTQAFEMCLMDYDFMVLDNAFLIHRPGIKTVKNNPTKPQQKLVNETNKFIASVIKPDIKKKVGDRKGCH